MDCDINQQISKLIGILDSNNSDNDSTALTLEMLDYMEPNFIFATGLGKIEHPWWNDAVSNLEDDGRSVIVRWVAVRGNAHDWAIYHSLNANLERNDYLDGYRHLTCSEEHIVRAGSKLRDVKKIKEFVKCTETAFSYYRF